MTTDPLTPSQVCDRRQEKASLEQKIKSSRRAVLVVNTRSRRGARYYSEAKHRLAEAGLTLDAAYPVRHAERLPQIVRQAIAQGHTFIIVGGGDGTISSVVDHFAYASGVLGVLPLGTANSFARTLAIPLDLAGAVDVLINGKVADVDLGKINEDYFANGSSIGLPAAVGRAVPHGLKRWFGRAGYLLVAANRFIRYKPFRCLVSIDGQETSFEALDVRIANGGYQGGVLVASEANVDSGEIVVHILKGTSKWRLVKEWARVALGAPLSPGDIEVVMTRELVINALPKQDVAIDGEVVTQTPIRVSVAHEALRLMAPRSFQARDRRRVCAS
jgi:YegS/Rv2252/BmrU family lipid kinase